MTLLYRDDQRSFPPPGEAGLCHRSRKGVRGGIGTSSNLNLGEWLKLYRRTNSPVLSPLLFEFGVTTWLSAK